MSRRYGLKWHGQRYCGNSRTKEVHDLDNEDGGPAGCQIDSLIAAGVATCFSPDTLFAAHQEGFSDCGRCLGAGQSLSREIEGELEKK